MTPTSKLCSQGKIRYHLEKSSLEFEGVFTRDNEIVHDDDDYETEVIKIGIFRPNKFSNAQNWIYISDHEMDQKRFTKELVPGLYCFFLKSQDQDLTKLGTAAEQEIALMHAKVKVAALSMMDYQAKRAFLF